MVDYAVYKVGVVITDGEQEGIASLYAKGHWRQKYFPGVTARRPAAPFFAFKTYEDARFYLDTSTSAPGEHWAIWHCAAPRVDAGPETVPSIQGMMQRFEEGWQTFWKHWLGEAWEARDLFDDEDYTGSADGSVLCPEITLIERVYPTRAED